MRNNLTWLHISDIHFNPRTEWRESTARKGLLKYLKTEFERDPSLVPDLIFCTGDIAYGETTRTPITDQYEQAKVFIDDLRDTCKGKKDSFPIDHLFVVPGNHDVNRASINSDAQETLTRWAGESSKYVNTVNSRVEERPREFTDAMLRLKEYENFVNHYLPHQTDDKGRLVYSKAVVIDDIKVGVAGLNSAWSCAGAQDDRTLWMGAEHQLNAVHQVLEESNIRIGLVHHPMDWLNLADREVFKKRASTDFDFLLHGHEHSAWVAPLETYTTFAAGAVGAVDNEEFGINIVKLNLEEGKGTVFLYNRKAGQNEWTIAPVPSHAPRGEWPINLPKRVLNWATSRIAPSILPAASGPIEPMVLRPMRSRFVHLYGRDSLLDEAATKLKKAPFLLLFGMRGNGKTEMIKKLADLNPLAEKRSIRIVANASTTAEDIYRQVGSALGETAETPLPPVGNIDEIAAIIKNRFPNPQPAWVWVDRAHMLLNKSGFKSTKVHNLFLGLQSALGSHWNWVFELRERPPEGFLHSIANECEVEGLNKTSLRQCLLDAAPRGHEEKWNCKTHEWKAMYQWLGGGQGEHAHPHATQLLIEVAIGLEQTPLEVLTRHRNHLVEQIENLLLNDLYHNVLNDSEQQMLAALSLYRTAIPHDHVDELEGLLKIPGAWDGLDRRCLLSPSDDHANYYLHNFIAAWLRTRQLGYAGDGEDDDAGFEDSTSLKEQQKGRDYHAAIASCWLKELKLQRRITNLNITRALEAFHHIVASGDPHSVRDIAVDLLHTNLEWAKKRMKNLCDDLFNTKAPNLNLLAALQFRAVLDPKDHQVQRFLGETYQKEEGKKSKNALDCFEKACELRRDFPPYWANLGNALIAKGRDGAIDFLSRLELLELDHPEAINQHVRSIKAICLTMTNDPEEARILRMTQINAGTSNPAFYNDEAKVRVANGDIVGALKMLNLAEERGFVNDYTKSIRANILQDTDPEAARIIRMMQIDANSTNPTFYNNEAKARMADGNVVGALEMLNLAEKRGYTDDYTKSIRANVLQATDPEAANIIRMEEIDANTSNPTFYNDEAKARMANNDVFGALEVLTLAEERGYADDYTKSIQANALQATDPEAAKTIRMTEINAGTSNSALYNDEAKARLAEGDVNGALEVLNLAEERGYTDDYSKSIRARATNYQP